MRQHVRRYALLVLAQAACLALGLWLEYRFENLAGRSAAEPSDVAANRLAADGASPEAGQIAAADVAWREIPPSVLPAIAFLWIVALQAGTAWLVLARAHEVASRKQSEIETVSLQRYNDLLRTRDAVIFGLAKLAESRDADTGNHLERIAIYSTRLAAACRRNSPYRNQIDAHFIQLIGVSSSLHDIGKVGVADSVLMKPGKFLEEERLMMQLHVAIGGKCVQDIETRLGQSNFLQMAREIALCHHERWDGNGYPEGLAGEEIPLSARIVAVADVYDALSTKRVYKDAIPHRQCVEMIRSEAGRHFDPVVVEAFLSIEKDFETAVKHCAEPHDESAAGAASSGDTETTPGKGNRFDDDLSLALDLLNRWAADPSSSAPCSAQRVSCVQGALVASPPHVSDATNVVNDLSILEEELAHVS